MSPNSAALHPLFLPRPPAPAPYSRGVRSPARSPSPRWPTACAAALLLLAAARAAAQAPSLEAPAAALAGDAAALIGDAATHLAPAAARVEVTAGTLNPRLRLAPCDRIEPFLPAGSRPWGRTRVGLRCADGAVAWTVYLPVTVRVLAPGMVLREALPAGTVLREQHLAAAEVDWAAAPSPVLAQPAAALGRALARHMASGAALRESDLRAQRWFAAGDAVSVVARGDGFRVSGEGLALGDGVDGQPVRVRTESGRIVSGRAVGKRRVEVIL
jgi:flagella basal body P-ring formation protein FlgA